MRFPEAPSPAGSREAFLPIVDARLAQHAAKLPAYPCLDISIVHRFAELILRGIAVYAVACLAAVFIKRFCVPDEILHAHIADLVALPCNARLAQLRPSVQRILMVCNPGVHDALACRLQFCRCQPVAGLQLHIQPCQLLCTDFLRVVLQRLVAEAVPDFLLQYRLDVFPLLCKICSPHCVVFGQLFCKLRFVHRGHFVHAAADDAVTREDAARHLVRQLRDLLLCGASGLVVHLPLDDCVCCRRRPGVCSVDLVAPVCLRVDALAWEDQRIVSVLCMPLARLHNSDRRRRDGAELQHTVHLLAVQIVNGHQVLRLLHRLVHGEPGLDRQPLLCYTGLRSICGHPNRAVFRFSCTILVLTGRRRCFICVFARLVRSGRNLDGLPFLCYTGLRRRADGGCAPSQRLTTAGDSPNGGRLCVSHFRRLFLLPGNVRIALQVHQLRHFFLVLALDRFSFICYNGFDGGCVRVSGLPRLFYWVNIIQNLFTVCGCGNMKCRFPYGVFFVLDIGFPFSPIVSTIIVEPAVWIPCRRVFPVFRCIYQLIRKNNRLLLDL